MNDLQRLSLAYESLLSTRSHVRVQIQPALCALRDAIAKEAGYDAEDVQNAHELISTIREDR